MKYRCQHSIRNQTQGQAFELMEAAGCHQAIACGIYKFDFSVAATTPNIKNKIAGSSSGCISTSLFRRFLLSPNCNIAIRQFKKLSWI
jgi:hypothetical protein